MLHRASMILPALAAMALPICGPPHPAAPPRPTSKPAQILTSARIELSGIAPAGQQRQFWGLSDSGNPAALFRFDDEGRLLQHVRLAQAANLDWEAMTLDGQGRLFIGDIGDNARIRGVYTVYYLFEKDLAADPVPPPRRFHFVYPDHRARNCEAMFIMDSAMYLVSKEKPGTIPPRVFRLALADMAANENPTEPLHLTEVGKLDIRGRVTDAAWSAALGRLAVLTYEGVHLYAVQTPEQLLTPPVAHIPGAFGACEALCFEGHDLIITSEAGQIWRVPVPL